MSEDEIQFGTDSYSYTDILSGKSHSHNSYFNDCIKFCREWLSGKQSFEIQTSGSTGKPKRIILSRTQMQLSAELTAEKLGLKRNEKALLCINAKYIGGMMMLVRAMHLGLRLRVYEPDSNPLKDPGMDEIPDFIAIVPLQLKECLENEREKLEAIRNVIVGGAGINGEIEQACRGLSNHIWHTYGMTETCSHFALKLLSTKHYEEHFHPLKNYKIALDERSCLTVCGPVTNFETLVTNDIARINEDASFDILGRADNVVNSGGLKLFPEQLEERLAEKIRGIAFFFAGLPDERLGQKLVLVAEGNEDLRQVLETAIADMGAYEKPKAIHILPKLEYTGNGKPDRRESLAKLKNKE